MLSVDNLKDTIVHQAWKHLQSDLATWQATQQVQQLTEIAKQQQEQIEKMKPEVTRAPEPDVSTKPTGPLDDAPPKETETGPDHIT